MDMMAYRDELGNYMTAQNTLDEIQNLRMSTASKVDIQTAIEQMEDVV